MNHYIITLQLGYPEETYTNLEAYLKSADFWARPMKNVWIINTAKTAVEIRDGISQRVNISLGDKVLVMPLPAGLGNWATNNIGQIVNDWLKRGGK